MIEFLDCAIWEIRDTIFWIGITFLGLWKALELIEAAVLWWWRRKR